MAILQCIIHPLKNNANQHKENMTHPTVHLRRRHPPPLLPCMFVSFGFLKNALQNILDS